MLYICKLRNQLDLNQAIRVSHKIIALQKTFPEFVPIFGFLFMGRFNKTFVYTIKNTYCLFQIKFITEYTNVQHVIITQI